MSIPHAIHRTEYQRSGGHTYCAIVCECHVTHTGSTWAEAGAAYDIHMKAATTAGEPIDYNPRDMDADPVAAWRAWGQNVGVVPVDEEEGDS